MPSMWMNSVCERCCACHRAKPAFRWTEDFYSKTALLIWVCLKNFSGACHLVDFFSLIFFSAFWVLGTQPTVHNGGVSRVRVCAYGCCRCCQVTGDTGHLTPYIWHLTPDTWHVTCGTWHVTHDSWVLFLFLFSCPLLSVSVCFCIGAAIRTTRLVCPIFGILK